MHLAGCLQLVHVLNDHVFYLGLLPAIKPPILISLSTWLDPSIAASQVLLSGKTMMADDTWGRLLYIHTNSKLSHARTVGVAPPRPPSQTMHTNFKVAIMIRNIHISILFTESHQSHMVLFIFTIGVHTTAIDSNLEAGLWSAASSSAVTSERDTSKNPTSR